jgi:lipase chaperone LimK
LQQLRRKRYNVRLFPEDGAMNKKKAIAVGAIALLVIIIISLIVRKNSSDGYVIDSSYKIKLKDIELYYKKVDFNEGNVDEYFANSIINPYTLKFFLSLDEKFKDSKNLEDHLERVRQYLLSIMSADEAEKLFAVYKTYMNYQIGLMEKTKAWGTPSSPEDAIAYLHKLQEYRREIFGKEAADALFGTSVKAQEYPLRRSTIIGDKDLYGAAKEKKLKELNKNMWGEEADAVEAYTKPYTKYQEKLQIYEKDLAELPSDSAKQEMIQKFREEIFTPDQVQRLDEVDKVIEQEKKKEEDYYARERRIKGDPNLDSEGKAKKIEELQNDTFGEEADAFRRRQAIEKGLEDAKSK